MKGQPNGGRSQNCGILNIENNQWNDISCTNPTACCTFCQMPSNLRMTLRGLCASSSLDTFYGLTEESKLQKSAEKFSFRGFSNSLLKWNESYQEWQISIYEDKNIYASCNESKSNHPFPIGVNNWYIFNDTCDDIENDQMVGKNIYKLPLSFVACNPNQYTCEDGTSWYALADI